MSKYLFCAVLALTILLNSCAPTDDPDLPDRTGPFTLEDLPRGGGYFEVTGDEEFAITGNVGARNSQVAAFEDKLYVVLTVQITSVQFGEGRNVNFKFFIPRELEQGIPYNGEIPLTATDAALDEIYATVLVRGESVFYGNGEESTGTITITNSSLDPVMFDMEFDIENLKRDDGRTIDVVGALKL